MLFVHQGDPADAEPFFARHWPEVRAIEDQSLVLYRGFGLGRGHIAEMFGPRALASGLRAALRGHRFGRPSGDVRVMPGAFLVEGDRVRFAHRAEHVGDHPSLDAVRAASSRPAS